MNDNPAIELRQACRFYEQGDQTIKAVDHVDLVIDRGEFATLAGPSGSGKTTLLNLIGGLDRPDKGEILVGGENTHNKSNAALSDLRRDHVGFVFQSYNLIPVLTAAENAEFVMLLQKIPLVERRNRISALFAEMGLRGMENRYPSELSGGQQQRVAVARAVASKPAIVLADEPTANLDSETAKQLLAMMRKMNRDHGVTFLFSTHDPLVIDQADRVIRMRDGKIVEDVRRVQEM